MKKIAILLLVLASIANTDAQIVPPHAIVAGQSIADWALQWYRWTFEGSTNQSPFLDPTGQWATNRQSGPVFFVPGYPVAFFGTNFTRHYNVPEDTFLLVPVLAVHVENIDTDPPLSVEELRNIVASYFDPPPDVHLNLDGVFAPNVPDHLETLPVFSIDHSTPDNLNSFLYGHPIVGTVDPIVAAGYWVMLEPLPPGTHFLDFGASYNLPGGFVYDRTDVITVSSIPLSERVAQLIETLAAEAPEIVRRQPLVASLQAAQKLFGENHFQAGINQLRAFDNKLRAQVAPSDPALADRLSESARQIIDKAANQITNH